jgi:iron complex outermembrane receptor protein
MKTNILLLLALLFSSFSLCQNSIKGKILIENGKPVPGATIKIKLKDKLYTTISNQEGYYRFDNLESGTFLFSASALGYENLTVKVNISGDIEQNFELLISNSNLPDVEVIGRTAKKYNSEYSYASTRISMLNKDIPNSIGTITKEMIADRQAFQLADAVKVIPGVVPSSFYNQYSIRGISQNEEGQIINGMRTRQYYFLQPITSHIERVEVLKGPASATFASVDPGGSINMVTKKPLSVDRKELSISAGSFATMRGTIDFTGPLNQNKTLLYRLNGAYQQASSYRDLVKNNSFLLTPSISYIPNDKTSINIEMIHSNLEGNLDRGQPIFGAVAGVTNLNSTPISLNLGASSDFFTSKELMTTALISHQFSKSISFNAAYMKQTWQEDLLEHRTNNAFAPDINNQPVNSLVGMQLVQRKQNWNVDNLNAYLNFDYSTGDIHHKLLIGYDLQSWEKLKGGGQNAARGFLLTNGSVANSFVLANAANYQTMVVDGRTIPRPNVPHFNLANPTYTLRNINEYTLNVRTAIPSALTTTNAIYVQEQLRFKKLLILLGLRQEWFEDITNYQTKTELGFKNAKLLPRIGLTYSINKYINLYATYLEGYQPQSNTVTLMPNTSGYFWTSQSAARFRPLESNLKEIGAKASLANSRLSLNMSLYEINQKNILLNAGVPAFPDSLITRGSQQSKGLEIDITGYINPNWQINASYSYIDARILEDNDPTLKGQRTQNTPTNSASLWSRYNFSNRTPLKNIGIGLGAQHNGSRIPWFTRAFETPAFTVFDMAIYYSPGQSKMQLAINVNNLFNRTYWIGAQSYTRLFPGAPRSFMLTATYRF